MEIIEDEVHLPNIDGASSLIQIPKLKRLKKSSSSAVADVARVFDDPIAPIQDPDLDIDVVDSFDDDLHPPFPEPIVDPIMKDSVSPVSESKDIDDGLDPLFSLPAVGEGFDVETLNVEREEEGFEKIGGIGGGIEKEKKVRKKLDLGEGGEEVTEGRKKKKRKREKYDEKEKERIRGRRKSEKERRVQLEQIHAESQRLLRETRDASFKPVPLVQKPISSVLEKIRLRKLEVLKQSSILCQSDSVSESDFSMDEIAPKDSSSTRNQNGARENDGNAQVASQMDLNDPPTTSISDVKEADKILESIDRDNDQLNDLDDSPNPCLPTIDLNSSPDYCSSFEEDNDKENANPRPPRVIRAVNMDSSPNAALAKAFLDDEAEEEDDSDQDLARFQENEEDDESDAEEMLNDLIATGYKEAPIDHEKRNLLHQKWLEQQDAAGTDDILQRLKYGQKQREPTYLLGEEEDGDDIDESDESDECDEEFEDDRSHDLPPTDAVHQNSKKAKQMIAQMFDDANDVYVHSDDEESEQTLLRQRVLKQKGEPSIICPAVNESSRAVFGLIKKLNIAPVIKKRGKNMTSSFDSLVTSGNSNSSSRSSFLNRATSISLPSSYKQASTTVRAFIFGRDDSNSRSGISTSESILDMDLKQNQPPKPPTSNKLHKSSQAKPTASQMKMEATTRSSSASLFQILRQSSKQFDEQLNKKSSTHHKITDTQVAHQFSVFKVQKVTKVQSRF